ncbi:MAG: hypothetical protein ACJ8AW_04265, partial [Rhodopila sp.]
SPASPSSARVLSGGEDPMDLTAELLPLTIPEVRRLLAPLFRPPAAPNTALRWSTWRRRHQQRARRAHWRRRQRLADRHVRL